MWVSYKLDFYFLPFPLLHPLLGCTVLLTLAWNSLSQTSCITGMSTMPNADLFFLGLLSVHLLSFKAVWRTPQHNNHFVDNFSYLKGFFFNYICVCLWVCAGTGGGQKRVSDLLDLESQTAVIRILVWAGIPTQVLCCTRSWSLSHPPAPSSYLLVLVQRSVLLHFI